jgi:hypothetical protein
MCDTTFPHALKWFVEYVENPDVLTALALHFRIEEEDQLIIPPDSAADYIKCPHCTIDINISALACTIFICGAATAHGGQLNQHDEAAARPYCKANTNTHLGFFVPRLDSARNGYQRSH